MRVDYVTPAGLACVAVASSQGHRRQAADHLTYLLQATAHSLTAVDDADPLSGSISFPV